MAKDIETISEELGLLQEVVNNNSQVLSSISAQIEEMKKDVGVLEKLILTGNGQDSVLSRVAVIEDKYDYISKQIEEIKRKQEEEFNKKPQGKEKFMQWLKISLILSPGIVSLIMQIIKLFVS